MRHLALLLASLFTVSAMCQEQNSGLITLDDLFKNGTFAENGIERIVSMADGIHYSAIIDNSEIAKFSYKTGEKVETIVSVSQMGSDKISRITNYVFDKTETKILFYIDRQDIYRRSFTAEYFVWDINSKSLTSISDERRQQVATFSPDGTKVAYVSDNNLYVKNLADGTESQITSDGQFNSIINGIPDWVYEEEFEYNRAFCWSPDGKNLSWCRFDESEVPVFEFSMFRRQQYPDTYSYKYPKAGERNSIVTVWNYNFDNQQKTQINVGEETDQYIPRIMWSPAGKLVIFRLNRLQNHLEMLYANVVEGSTQVFYDEQNKWFVDEGEFDCLTFNSNGSKFFFMSERDGWNHIYMYSADGTLLNQVTKGDWDVTDFIGFDEKTNTVFYQSAESSPINRDIYSISADGKRKTKISQRIGTNEVVFSKGFKFYISIYSDANTPTVYTLHDRSGKQLRVLEDNARLVDVLESRKVSRKEFLSFTTPEGISLNAWMMKPVDFDSAKRYPVLMVQYSGPNSQRVLNEFSIGWEQVLTSNGYVVFCCDGRGTGARGEEFRKLTYLQLGKYELADQLNGANYLKTLPFIDPERVGIYGWSFGGFMALNCLTQGNGTFKAGIAVAPVTNWRYYDNIYTERFMRTPQENPQGYDDNSPITHASKLQGSLLLIHGSADDNVHWQNSTEMSEALVQANKQFEYFVYTDKNHGIRGGNTTYHLYTKKLDFLLKNL